MTVGEKPLPVEVANVEPLEVTVTAAETPKPVVTAAGEWTLPPTTTAQEDIVTAGQRKTSLIWEGVQGFIAVSITLATIYCAVAQVSSETIVNAFFFIVATYFTRTNHTRIGGIGPKATDNQPYRGR